MGNDTKNQTENLISNIADGIGCFILEMAKKHNVQSKEIDISFSSGALNIWKIVSSNYNNDFILLEEIPLNGTERQV